MGQKMGVGIFCGNDLQLIPTCSVQYLGQVLLNL